MRRVFDEPVKKALKNKNCQLFNAKNNNKHYRII